MRNGGLLLAHLPTSPHSNPVAAIVSDLKAIMSNAIAASAEKAARHQKLLDEHPACACQEAAAARARVSNAIARALQEAAHCQKLLDEQAARARQEAAAARARVSNAIARARQEAARRQQLLNEQAARACQEAAAARACQEETTAIWRIWVQCALLAAPLDAILAKIEHNNIAHKANTRQ
jgi:hypothetical protein